MPDGRDRSPREWLADVLQGLVKTARLAASTHPTHTSTGLTPPPPERDSSRGQATRVGSLSQESLPQRHERVGSFGAALRGVVAAAECVEQIRAVGGHQ
jgi:hypothetical protein